MYMKIRDAWVILNFLTVEIISIFVPLILLLKRSIHTFSSTFDGALATIGCLEGADFDCCNFNRCLSSMTAIEKSNTYTSITAHLISHAH